MAYNVGRGDPRDPRTGQALPATQLDAAQRHRPRSRSSTAHVEVRSGGARRRCSTSSATSTATATAGASCPTASRSTLQMRVADRRRSTRQYDELWQRSLTRVGLRVEFVKQKWPDLLKVARARTAADVAGSATSARRPKASASSACSTAGTRASPTCRGSSCPSSTGSTSRRARCPTARSATKLMQRMSELVIGIYAPWDAARLPLRERARAAVAASATSTTRSSQHPWQYLDIDRERAARPRSSDRADDRAVRAPSRRIVVARGRRSSRWRWPRAAQRAVPPIRTRCCASRFRSPKPASIRRRRQRPLFATTSSARSSTRSTGSTTWRGRTSCVPSTAAAMPRDLGRRHARGRSSVKPGIYFADDPAFKGKKRELTAADYVYAWKRLLDPRMRSPFAVVSRRQAGGIAAPIAAAKEAGRPIRLRRADRRPAGARPLHAAAQARSSPTTSLLSAT